MSKIETSEWPFTAELLPIKDLFVDLRYQRPPQEVFVEKMIQEFDETLVGMLDVSERKDGTHAILDGAQRYQAVQKFKNAVYCAVYTGMSLSDEAMFFYRKNKNRRSVHPFYQFRALLVTGDKQAIDINRIVKSEGYKLEVGARPDHHLTAIRAVEDAYRLHSLQRKESLSATLHVMRNAFFGRKDGKEGALIRGLATFFQPFDAREIDDGWLIDKLAAQNPQTLMGRAEDSAQNSRHSIAYHLARDVAEMYNRGRPSGKKVSVRFIASRSS